jgi:hypothetical protein
MPKIEYADKQADELIDHLGSRRIQDIRFPTNTPAVDILFGGQIFIRLNYPAPKYRHDGKVELRDRKNIIGGTFEISGRDSEALLMAYNLLESKKTGGFIRTCGEHVEDLWTD